MVFRLLQKEIPSIHGAAFLIGAAGLLSRILGVLRDRLLASHFGASRTLDVYYASFQIPDFLFTVFLVGAASAAIVPLLIEYQQSDEKKASLLIGGLLSIFSFGAVILSLLVAVLAPFLVSLIAPGFQTDERALMVVMTRIMMLSPIFLGLSNIFSAVLQARRQFLAFALTAVFYNLGIIAGILFFVPVWGPIGLAWGVALGAFLHLSIQFPVLARLNFRPRFVSLKHTPGLRQVFLLSLPRVFALSLNQIIIIILVSLGSLLSAGSITIFQFSNNLRYLPIGIFGVSYAIAAFPKLTEAALKKSKEVFYADLGAVVETILFWVVPLAGFTVLLRAHIVRLALGAGLFGWSDTRLTAAALAIFAISMIAEALAPILIRAFYAIGNTRLPLVVSLFTALFVVTSAPLLLSLFTSRRISGKFVASFLKVGDLSDVGVLGLVLAFTLGSIVHVTLLALALSFETRRYFNGSVANGMRLAVLRTGIAALAATLVGYGVLYLLSFLISLSTFWGVLGEASITFLVGASFYAALMYVMGSEEMRSIIVAIRQKTFRSASLLTEISENGDRISK